MESGQRNRLGGSPCKNARSGEFLSHSRTPRARSGCAKSSASPSYDYLLFGVCSLYEGMSARVLLCVELVYRPFGHVRRNLKIRRITGLSSACEVHQPLHCLATKSVAPDAVRTDARALRHLASEWYPEMLHARRAARFRVRHACSIWAAVDQESMEPKPGSWHARPLRGPMLSGAALTAIERTRLWPIA